MYLFQDDPRVGGTSLLVAMFWIALLLIGVYMLRGARPTNPVRAAFRRRLALGLAIISGLGLLSLLIRWLDGNIIEPGTDNLPIISWRLWSYLILLVNVGFLGYMYRYYTGRYKREVAETRHVRVVRPTRQQQKERPEKAASTNGTAETEAKQQAVPGRRESRRDRKRRKR